MAMLLFRPSCHARRRLNLAVGLWCLKNKCNNTSSSPQRRLSLARLFKANGVKLSDDALEILDEAQFHRVRPFYTWILSSRFMARRGLLKELVQFIPDRFQILTWVSQ